MLKKRFFMKYYRKLFYTIIIIIIFISCKKHHTNIISDNIDDSNSIQNIYVSVPDDIENSLAIIENKKPLITEIQDIINNYASTAPELNHSHGRKLSIQIEGNFTGSGNREIIAIYESLSGASESLDGIFCFVLNFNEDEIENIYYIDWWGTSSYIEGMELKNELAKILGKPIIWKFWSSNWKIGYTGDFNGNGLEELYFYSNSGRGPCPYFYEFDGMEFKNILKISPPAYITDIDPEKKIIIIKDSTSYTLFERSDYHMEENFISYIWKETTRQYEFFSSESKYFRYNIDKEQYDEIFF